MIGVAIVALSVCLSASICGLVLVVRTEQNHRRDEQTANRMERAELLQRIQAPDMASAAAFYGKRDVNTGIPVMTMPEEHDIDVERQWEESDESIVPFDEDLTDLAIPS